MTKRDVHLESLREVLGITVDAEMLNLALTHRSYAYEHGGIAHNERLEFLGDSVLGIIITDTLYRTQLGYTDNDFLDRGWRWRSDARVESRSARASSSIALPARDDGWQHAWLLQYNQSDIAGLLQREGSLTFNRTAIDERRQPQWSLGAHLEQQQPDGSPSDTVRAVFGAYRYTRRTTDDLLSPNRGTNWSVQAGAAAPGLSTRTFGRGVVQVVHWIPLGRTSTVMVRAEGGTVVSSSTDGIPESFLFRTGGDTSIRGYAYQSIGVKKGAAVTGGRMHALASVEATRWINERLGIAAFFLAPQGRWKVAAGVGAAAWVAFGTLRFVWSRVRGATGMRFTAEMLGMTLAHLGVSVFLAGALLVEGLNAQRELALSPGQSIALGGYEFRFEGVAHRDGPNFSADRGTVAVSRDGVAVATLHPEKRTYLSGGQVMTEAALLPGATRDLYVALGEPLGGDAWAVRVHVKPYVRWIWLGALLMALGGFVTATDRRFRRQAADANATVIPAQAGTHVDLPSSM